MQPGNDSSYSTLRDVISIVQAGGQRDRLKVQTAALFSGTVCIFLPKSLSSMC